MKLLKVEIRGYKSIENLTVEFAEINGSHTHILLGKNETGKSNILEALSAAIREKQESEVSFLGVRNRITEPSIVSIFYEMQLENPGKYRESILKTVDVSSGILEKIEVTSAIREVYISESASKYSHEWQFKYKSFSTRGMLFKKLESSSSNNSDPSVIIRAKQEVEKDSLEEYSELTFDVLEEILKDPTEEYFERNQTTISTWKPNDSHLVEDGIALKAFAEKPYSFPPLKNVFCISGFSETDTIAKKISEIFANTSARRGLARKLSKDTTSYLNTKWPELRVKVDVEISEEMVIHVNVQDEDNEDQFYAMNERSEGFKQFASLLLSIAVDHSIGGMRNNLIIIDEPEVHLHPSGIRYMLKELLAIGRDNYVLVATHSNFMIDNCAKERHFIVAKKKGQTTMKQIASDNAINDDEILQSAFGINVIRDFLPKNKLLVEGACDKILLQKAFGCINSGKNVVIANGHGGNLKAIASICGFQDIHPIVVVDDDRDGQKYKREVLAIGGGYKSSTVKTIRDLNGEILSGGTIEDALDADYVASRANAVLKGKGIQEIVLDQNRAFCEQLRIHINQTMADSSRTQKDEMAEEIKALIAKKFNPSNLETSSPKLHRLATSILELF